MDVDIFCLCDYSQQDSNGKLTIVGVFDRMWVDDLPAKRSFSLALRLRLPEDEIGEHEFKIDLRKEGSESSSADVAGKFGIKESTSDIEYATANLSFQINKFEVQELGVHVISLYVDGKMIKDIPFTVDEIKS